jgi:hypothetical protein
MHRRCVQGRARRSREVGVSFGSGGLQTARVWVWGAGVIAFAGGPSFAGLAKGGGYSISNRYRLARLENGLSCRKQKGGSDSNRYIWTIPVRKVGKINGKGSHPSRTARRKGHPEIQTQRQSQMAHLKVAATRSTATTSEVTSAVGVACCGRRLGARGGGGRRRS